MYHIFVHSSADGHLGCFHFLQKEMAAHSSIPAWRISWTEKPGGLQSMGLQRVRHDWATSLTYLACLGYYKEFCNEHWGAGIFSKYSFLQIYAQKWDCWVIWQSCFQFSKELPERFCSGGTSPHSHQQWRRLLLLFTLSSVYRLWTF